MCKVSVIIPTYNRADTLHLAIKSVLNQTFQDFEIIIVDDASKDNTQEIIRDFNDKRIKYIYHELNKGEAAARNTGVKNSSGEYIAFLDDDDEWLPEKLDMQVCILENSPLQVGCVHTAYLIIDKSNGMILDIGQPNVRGNLFRELLIGNYIGPSAVLLRRKCFEEVGLFDEDLPYCVDYDMWIRMAEKFDFEYIKEPLFKYYHHGDKMSARLELVIAGREKILRKYSQLFMLDRKTYGRRYLELGMLYSINGQTKKAMNTYLRAIKLYPFATKHYLVIAISLFGGDLLEKIIEIKGKVVWSFGKRKIYRSIDKQ